MSNTLRDAPYASNAPRVENVIITGGTLNNVAGSQYNYHGPREALQLLKEKVSSAAFHNSKERFDPPKCHENTRVAILRKIMDWIMSRDPDTKDKLIIWLNGAAGAGKSAIAQTLAELCDEQGFLLACFFFGRLDPTRNHAGSLIVTIAYQILTCIPTIKEDILEVIEADPLNFDRNIITQLKRLINQPLQRLIQANYFETPRCRRVIIIDGLDECESPDSQSEVISALFQAVNQFRIPVLFLVASRPEIEITTAFSSDTSKVLGRIQLDDEYCNDDDIELFLRDQLRHIQQTHPHRRHLPKTWPEDSTIRILVAKSSGQFIYAATVVKYVKSPRKRPDHRLEIILGLRPRANDTDMPFAELDVLYTHILSSSEDTTLILDILRFIMNASSSIAGTFCLCDIESLFELDAGSVDVLLCDFGALVEIIDIPEGQTIKIFHASLQDFLNDSARSKVYYRDPTETMIEQLKKCFKFIIHCNFESESPSNNNSFGAVGKFFLHLANEINCDVELANMLEADSIARLMRHLPKLTGETYDLYVNLLMPELLHFFKRSEIFEAYVNLQAALDREYRTMIRPYYMDTGLSFILAIVSQLDSNMSDGLTETTTSVIGNTLSLSSTQQFHAVEDRMWQNELIFTYLRSPERSKQYCIQASGGRLYANAILHCLQLLGSPELSSYFPPGLNYSNHKPTRRYNDIDEEIISHWRSSGPQNGNHVFEYFEILQTSLEDDPSTAKDPILKLLAEDYFVGDGIAYECFVLLQYILYFFPRAGRCEKLLHLCETKALPKAIVKDEHRKIGYCAMDAYTMRWKEHRSGSPEVDEWAYPLPLVKIKRSAFTHEEKCAILQLRAESDRT